MSTGICPCGGLTTDHEKVMDGQVLYHYQQCTACGRNNAADGQRNVFNPETYARLREGFRQAFYEQKSCITNT